MIHLAVLPKLHYSDFNGYGHYLFGWGLFVAHWSLITLALMALAIQFWHRGAELTFAQRFIQTKSQPIRLAAPVLFVAFVAAGFSSYINQETSFDEYLLLTADYELKYKKTEVFPQLRINGIYAEVNIFPDQRRAEIDTQYVLINEETVPVRTIYIDYPRDIQITIENLTIGNITEHNQYMGFLVFELHTPILPGNEMIVDFNIVRQETMNSGAWFKNRIQPDGTFFTNAEALPQLGYNRNKELSKSKDRVKAGLSNKQEKPPNNASDLFIGGRFNLINFEAIISTKSEQTAITSGLLQGACERDGRSYFHYKSRQPIVPDLGFLFGQFEVKSVMADEIPIRLYYSKRHQMNTDAILSAAKHSMEYFNHLFSPYPFADMKLVEFTMHLPFGQSFANTIALSEASGFTKDTSDRPNHVIDRTYFIIAHEIAHQWWAHQLIPSQSKGASILSESLAQYSALIALEKRYGKAYLKRVLLDEQSRYFSERNDDEVALISATSDLSYVLYNKGGLALYQLQQVIGGARINKSLRKLLSDHNDGSYAGSNELVTALLLGSPGKYHGLIIELFEEIITYNNRITDAKATRQENGHWLVNATIQYLAFEKSEVLTYKKTEYTPTIDIEVHAQKRNPFGSNETLLKKSSINIENEFTEISIMVKEQPSKLILDPWLQYLDKNQKDNFADILTNVE